MTEPLAFAKYEAAGNDFILIEDPDDERAISAEGARSLCDRWFGVGADGVIRVTRGDGAPFAMHLTNADGSAAEMSGNGMRCLGAYLHDHGGLDGGTVEVETPAGIRRVWLDVDHGVVTRATVSMGAPNFTRSAIPMRGPAWETFLDQPFDIDGRAFAASAVSMGNPHLVLFSQEDPEGLFLEHIGPELENNELFPERTNVEFARMAADGPIDTIDVRVWERGVGETLSCGTGACAVAVTANEAGLTPAAVNVRFRGGTLSVDRRQDGDVWLGGSVTHVFDGRIDLAKLEGDSEAYGRDA